MLSETGVFLAHTNAELVGQPAAEHEGSTEAWGDTCASEFVDPHGELIDEYRKPLDADGTTFGTLIYAIPQPDLWGYVRRCGPACTAGVLGPACCMVLGAVLLNRMVRPVADIEQQLSHVATSPSLESCELRRFRTARRQRVGTAWSPNAFSGHVDTLRQQIRQSLPRVGRAGWMPC